MTAAKKIDRTEWTGLEEGVVTQVTPSLCVELEAGTALAARRAKSCLTAPEPGDRVLCAVGRDDCFVIAVLEGAEGAPNRLATEAPLELAAPRVEIRAGDVDVVARGSLGLVGAELHARAGGGTFAVDRLAFAGKHLQAQLQKIAIVAEQADHYLGRLTQRAKRVLRFVEETDQTRAGTVDVRAETLLGLRGENAVVSARVLAKVDGEQIHIG